MGDPQYGGGSSNKNTFQINAMNAFPGNAWREGMPSDGQPVAAPRGVLIAGDLTQNGKDGRWEFFVKGEDQIGRFISDYGLTGQDGLLHYPVYEGYGNHDFEPDEPDDAHLWNWRWYYGNDPTPSVDSVSERNANRVGLTQAASGKAGHYSWDWDRVHFVNLNLFPGDEPSDDGATSRIRDPRGALIFLKNDLQTHVGNSQRPVIIMCHYGFDSFSREARWWQDSQRELFQEAIEGYNLIAYIHGHVHGTHRYSWQGYDIYNVGSPYYSDYNADGKGHFTVFRIRGTTMEVSDVAWRPENQGGDPHFTGWRHVKTIINP